MQFLSELSTFDSHTYIYALHILIPKSGIDVNQNGINSAVQSMNEVDMGNMMWTERQIKFQSNDFFNTLSQLKQNQLGNVKAILKANNQFVPDRLVDVSFWREIYLCFNLWHCEIHNLPISQNIFPYFFEFWKEFSVQSFSIFDRFWIISAISSVSVLWHRVQCAKMANLCCKAPFIDAPATIRHGHRVSMQSKSRNVFQSNCRTNYNRFWLLSPLFVYAFFVMPSNSMTRILSECKILENQPKKKERETIEIPFHPHRLYTKQPLFNMEFFIVGATKLPRQEIERKVRAMGGKMATRIHSNLTAVISNAEVVETGEGIIREAFIHRIQVIPDDFLNEVLDNDPIKVINRKNLIKYGKNVCSFFYFSDDR